MSLGATLAPTTHEIPSFGKLRTGAFVWNDKLDEHRQPPNG
jgi:hypothetical protein